MFNRSDINHILAFYEIFMRNTVFHTKIQIYQTSDSPCIDFDDCPTDMHKFYMLTFAGMEINIHRNEKNEIELSESITFIPKICPDLNTALFTILQTAHTVAREKFMENSRQGKYENII